MKTSKLSTGQRPGRTLAFLAALTCLILNSGPSWGTVSPQELAHSPEYITSETDPVLYMDASRDGNLLVFTSGRESFTDLWLVSADPAKVLLPRRLTKDPSEEASPAFSSDGRYIAYVGGGYDVKGDIYLLDLESATAKPIRLTGRETEDGGPCFSPDGEKLYFHQSRAGEALRKLASIDLGTVNVKETSPGVEGFAPQVIETGGDGIFPAVSPDGKKLAFVSFRINPSGGIFLLDLTDNHVRPLTSGVYMDFSPTWSPDGKSVYFSRIDMDTDHDGEVTSNDHAALFRLTIDDKNHRPYPITPPSYSAFQPRIAGERLFFLSNRGGVNNCFFLPSVGAIPRRESAAAQIELAEGIAGKFPFDPYLTLIAYYKIPEWFPESAPSSARALYEVGMIQKKLDMPHAALSSFRIVEDAYGKTEPEAGLSLIEREVLDIRASFKAQGDAAKRMSLIESGITRLESIAMERGEIVRARAHIEAARLLSKSAGRPSDLLKAISLLDDVIAHHGPETSLSAEAMMLKADVYSRVGSPEKVYPAYLSVIGKHQETGPWADMAVDKILKITLAGHDKDDVAGKIRLLRELSEKNRAAYPLLAMGALNLMGDYYFAVDNWSSAKETYREVLDQFPVIPTKTAAARLSLAEIFYREERFRKALDLYETEISLHRGDDSIYQLARSGYIRKSIASGEFLYRSMEIHAARKVFSELMIYDDSIIEAHRGYIKCAAALSGIHSVLSAYRARLTKSPNDTVALYATGLSLTYLNNKAALVEARELIRRAISINGHSEYFHQTLGYVNEVLETVHGEKEALESALECYKTAYFLNDHRNNPANAANLSLNLGNIYYLLGQYQKAFESYSLRLEADEPFEQSDTEILFYQRLGASAYQTGEKDNTVSAYSKALELIDRRMDSRRASETLDKLHRYIMDKIISPALRQDHPEESVQMVSTAQTAISRKLARISETECAPPGAAWDSYKMEIETLLKEQEQVIPKAVSLVKHSPDTVTDSEQITTQTAEQMLASLLSKTKEDLRHPERLIQLKAEMLDRLGLALQESGDHGKAAERFQQAFLLNQRMNLNQNLARNLRSKAYNTYMLCESLSGEPRTAALKTAAEDFSQVIHLASQYGVPERKSDKSAALINLSIQTSLDDAGATQAAYGFTADQEIRLAQAFISRICLELGELTPAEAAAKDQIAKYPVDKPVSDKDIYGVSLLYHRAGLLAHAQAKHEEAAGYFGHSAQLCLSMQTPVSAAINVENMAKCLLLMGEAADDGAAQSRISQLDRLDRETDALLKTVKPAAGKPVPAIYHNIMGVYVLSFCSPQVSETENAVLEIRRLQKAGAHFSAGLAYFNPQPDRQDTAHIRDRRELGLICTLHLNMAGVAQKLGEKSQAQAHFQTALEISEMACLPQFEWRALAGLGRLDDALQVLERLTVFSASCGPGEIEAAFAPLVEDLVNGDKAEEAFNLSERLSEIERFNRTAFMINELTEEDKTLLKALYPQVERMQSLRQKAAEAKGEEKLFLEESLDREVQLMRNTASQKGEGLPEILRLIPKEETREKALILLGLAADAEAMADEMVRKRNPNTAETLRNAYTEKIERYRKLLSEMTAEYQDGASSNLIALLTPLPAEAIEVMDVLAEGGTLLRFFKTGRPSTPLPESASGETAAAALLTFRITADEVSVSSSDSMKDALKRFVPPDEGTVYVACEDLSELPPDAPRNCALSATHLFRSFKNRNPFKRTLLAIPTPKTPIEGYDTVDPQVFMESGSKSSLRNLNAHTLFVSERTFQTVTVPTHAEEIPSPFLAINTAQGKRLRVDRLLASASNLSLSLLPGASMTDAYLTGHLFSLSGCPTVILPDKPATESKFSDLFLNAYRNTSAHSALMKAEAGQDPSDTQERPKWVCLGFSGMTPEASARFAEEHFVRYVEEGQAAFQNNQPGEALALFENAIAIASEIEQYRQHLSTLYRYGRESAYRCDRMDKAADFAAKLKEIMANEKPDSEAHAEALLTYGLILSRLEQYDKAIPLLEEALEIMANLELGKERIEAMDDLGVVLENATEYDRALSLFRSAATLSEEMDKKELLARQYENAGRINDLRLSKYALAIKDYTGALNLYREINRIDLAAASLLDIGRCYRLLGNFPEADRLYREALTLVDSLPEDTPDKTGLLVKIQMEQANNAWFQARYEDAFELERSCYKLAREYDLPLAQVMALNTSGLIWWTLGNTDKALMELEKALSLAKKLVKRDDEVATALNNIGLIHRETGKYAEALDAFDQAFAIDTRLKSRWAIAYDLRNKALLYLKMGQPEKAVPLFREACQEASSIGDKVNEAKALLGLGDALMQTGSREEAETSFKKALELSDSMAIRETKWRSIYGLAQLKLAENTAEADADAEKLLFEAVTVIEGMRSDIKIDQLKDSFLSNKLSVYESLVKLLAAKGKIVESFEVAEGSRARNFIDLLGNQRLSLNRAVDQELYDQQAVIRARIEEHEALLAQSTGDAERDAYRTALQGLNNDYQNLMLDIQAKNPQLGALISVEPLKADALCSLLEPDTALLAYYALPEEVFCWVIRRSGQGRSPGIHLVHMPIGRDSLGETILSYRRAIQNLDPLEDLSSQLFSLLLPDQIISGLSGVKKLGIIPHGPLHYLSFATLGIKNEYLIDRFPLFYLPSASVLEYTFKKRNPGKNFKVLAIGNPDLGDPVLDLPFATHEVGTIKWNFPDITLLSREKATEEWVASHINEFGIIHLASHGEFNPVNPLFSAVKLSKAGKADGNLEAAEVFGLNINADLVVLSACQTGLGKVTDGDDVIGLNRAFFYAGTHAIVSSLWRVSDISTAILIKQFYRQYKTYDKAESLQRAILHVKNRYPHPGYWGAFTLVGDYY